jgi:hypothetical protein
MRRPAPLLLLLLVVSSACKDSTAPAPVPTAIEITPAVVSLKIGQTQLLQARVLDPSGRALSLPAGQQIVWSSSDTSRISVDGAGLARGMRPGSASITAALGALKGDLSGSVLAPQPQMASGSAARATIGFAGGSISATHAGFRYTLTVPEGALLTDAEITLTPLNGITDFPGEGAPLAAVHFSPEGLRFMRTATLEIESPAPLPARPAGFGLSGDGEALHLAPAGVNGTRTVLLVAHFSIWGIFPLDPQTVGFIYPPPPSEAQQRAEHDLALEILRGAETHNVLPILRTWYTRSIRVGLANAGTDELLVGALAEFHHWLSMTMNASVLPPEVVGDLLTALEPERVEARSLLAAALRLAVTRSNGRCVAAPRNTFQPFLHAENALRWWAIAHLESLDTAANGLDYDTVLQELCIKVRYISVAFPEGRLLTGQAYPVDVGAGISFDGGAPVPISSAIMVTVNPLGASGTSLPLAGLTDGGGFFRTELVPQGGAVVVYTRSCVDMPFSGPRFINSVCADTTVARYGITIAPDRVRLEPGGSQQFTATLTGGDQSVTWTTTDPQGSVSSSGLYTAGQTPGSYQVTVTSVAEPSNTASAAVTIDDTVIGCYIGTVSIVTGDMVDLREVPENRSPCIRPNVWFPELSPDALILTFHYALLHGSGLQCRWNLGIPDEGGDFDLIGPYGCIEFGHTVPFPPEDRQTRVRGLARNGSLNFTVSYRDPETGAWKVFGTFALTKWRP